MSRPLIAGLAVAALAGVAVLLNVQSEQELPTLASLPANSEAVATSSSLSEPMAPVEVPSTEGANQIADPVMPEETPSGAEETTQNRTTDLTAVEEVTDTAPAAEDASAEEAVPTASADPVRQQMTSESGSADTSGTDAGTDSEAVSQEDAGASITLQTETAALPDITAPETNTDTAGHDAIPPVFDLVRVEDDGSAIAAGRAAPGSNVEILLDGVLVSATKASGRGEFVAFFSAEPSSAAQEVSLRAVAADGAALVSAFSVFIVVEPAEAVAAGSDDNLTDPVDETQTPAQNIEAATESDTGPLVMLETEDGVSLLNQEAPGDPDQVRFSSISYSIMGDVIATGTGVPASRLVLYVDDTPIGYGRVREDGRWRVILGELEEGIYTLRVDQFNRFDQLISRAETPFQRVFPETNSQTAVASGDNADGGGGASEGADAETRPRQIVVQPGNNLWTIARVELGAGIRYTQIFEANADQIRDPDLIYPGQVFTLEVD